MGFGKGSEKLLLEFVDFFNGKFSYKPEFETIKKEFSGEKIDELFVVLTSVENVKSAFSKLQTQLEKHYAGIKVTPV